MDTIDIISIIFLAIFTLACVIIAVALGVWWYAGCGAMTALLANTVYEEGKNDQ